MDGIHGIQTSNHRMVGADESNAHEPSPQPTACSLTTQQEVTRPKTRLKPTSKPLTGFRGRASFGVRLRRGHPLVHRSMVSISRSSGDRAQGIPGQVHSLH